MEEKNIKKEQTLKKILNDLIEINSNLEKLPDKYLDILTESIGGHRLISLDFAEVKKILKSKKIIYDYVDFKINSTTDFINLLKSKFNKNKIIIIYVLNQDSGNLDYINKHNEDISKLKEIPFHTHGMILNNISQPKILIIGTQ